MVCMFDGNLYAVTREILETLSYEKLFEYFNNSKENTIIAIYDADNHYTGGITYYSLVSGTDLSSIITNEKLLISNDEFWIDAYKALAKRPGKVLPVFNCDMDMLYLARFDKRLQTEWKKLNILISLGMQAGLWVFSQHSEKHFHFIDCNMVLYYFRQWLISQGKSVSVSGEKWEVFGIQQQLVHSSETVIVDESCEEINYLYDEFMFGLKEELTDLENVLGKEFVGNIDAEDKIIFWMPSVSGIFSSYNIISLILTYLKAGKVCIVAMPTKEDLIHRGSHWLKVAIEFMGEIQAAGGNICLWDDVEKLRQGKYSVCFTPMVVDVPRIPEAVRMNVDVMVVVQSLAFFAHYYRVRDTYCTFEGEFTDESRAYVDFFVASDFIADWICQQDNRWSGKMLRFGYPKQDMLYRYIHGKQDIPEEWLIKTKGKKVFLFTELKESWFEELLRGYNQVIIVRPHPDWLNIYGEVLKKLVEISQGRIILDDRASYNASFYLADAMITEPLCSVGVNYLSTGKPMLFRSDVIDESDIKIDFRQEDWYKAAYIGTNDQDIFDFMDMVRRGEDVKKQKLEKYRNRMVEDFDGKVCERIYNFFENYR